MTCNAKLIEFSENNGKQCTRPAVINGMCDQCNSLKEFMSQGTCQFRTKWHGPCYGAPCPKTTRQKHDGKWICDTCLENLNEPWDRGFLNSDYLKENGEYWSNNSYGLSKSQVASNANPTIDVMLQADYQRRYDAYRLEKFMVESNIWAPRDKC